MYKRQIETSYTENFLSFEFAALDFTSPQKNQYAYQLEGVDKNWIYSGNRHFVSYSQIPPGDYVFKVKASNSDGVWNETPLTLKVRVTAPFWTKDWFRFLAIMAVSYTHLDVYKRQVLGGNEQWLSAV